LEFRHTFLKRSKGMAEIWRMRKASIPEPVVMKVGGLENVRNVPALRHREHPTRKLVADALERYTRGLVHPK